MDEDDFEVEQTRSVNEKFAPEQDEQDNLDTSGVKPSTTRQTYKHSLYADYIHRKKSMRTRHLPAVTLTAVQNAGTQITSMRGCHYDMLSQWECQYLVLVPLLRRNDYVSFYSVKETLTGDQYRERYPKGATKLTDAQLWARTIQSSMKTICT